MYYANLLIGEDANLSEAMQQLNTSAKQILFVVEAGVLLATITDGDIRRYLLKAKTMETTVKAVANYNPKSLLETDIEHAKAFMEKYDINALPIVDQDNRLIDIILYKEDAFVPHTKIDVPVVLMAGGLGSRLLPYTKILPKPLIPIAETPIVERIINSFSDFGCRDFYMIVNYKKNMIKSYFDELEKDYQLNYVDEDTPLGTGGGLSLLKGKIDKTFILSNCDILIKADYGKIYEHHKKENNLITMVCSLKKIAVPYGVIDVDDNGQIEAMKEKPSFSYFVNTGVYVVDPLIIEELKIEEVIGFPTIIENYKNKGYKVGIYPIEEDSWFDMGEFDKMQEMEKMVEGLSFRC